MKTARRILNRLWRGIMQWRNMQPKSAAPVETAEVTVPGIPLGLVSDELKTWVDEVGIHQSHSVDCACWHHGVLEDVLLEIGQGEGSVGLYFHGGSYVVGSAKEVHSGSARIPRGLVEHEICSCVLAVDYTLVTYLANALRISPKRITLVGDSAGGHLVCALLRYLSESRAIPSPSGAILLSLWCDLSAEVHVPHIQRLLGPFSTDRLSSPYFSPALHMPPAQWPLTFIYYGETERFVSSIAALTSQLMEGGLLVTSYMAKGIPPRFSHDFLILLSVERMLPSEVQKCWRG